MSAPSPHDIAHEARAAVLAELARLQIAMAKLVRR